jgi:serine/threonine-protein kinase
MRAHAQVVANRFRLVEQLGHGGMAYVWKARDIRLERDVALKFMMPPTSDDDTWKDWQGRLIKEAKRTAAVSHSHLVRVFDVGTDGEEIYLVLELLAGRTLAAELAVGPFEFERAWNALLPAMGGIAA